MTPRPPVFCRPPEPSEFEALAAWEARLPTDVLHSKVRHGQILVALRDHEMVGWVRWGLFWDLVPILNRIHVLEGHRRTGVGRALLTAWENLMAEAGHARVLTTTQSDEDGQHFFRTVGYRDAGGLTLPGEPLEIFMVKEVGSRADESATSCIPGG